VQLFPNIIICFNWKIYCVFKWVYGPKKRDLVYFLLEALINKLFSRLFIILLRTLAEGRLLVPCPISSATLLLRLHLPFLTFRSLRPRWPRPQLRLPSCQARRPPRCSCRRTNRLSNPGKNIRKKLYCFLLVVHQLKFDLIR
jgi:hypothetical protein